jgi:acetyl esterase/lipase
LRPQHRRRLTDFAGLAEAYVEVGELDIFRDESNSYTEGLFAAGVSAELHVHPGCPHGYDRAGSSVDIVVRSRANRIRVLKAL